MKKTSTLALGAWLATFPLIEGCISVKTEDTPAVTVVKETQPGYVIRTLPAGYETVVVSGTRYYTFGGVYYRQQRGGYVVTNRPL